MQTPGELASKLPTNFGSRKILSTRRGTIGVAAVAALAALAVMLVFMNNYRHSVPGATTVKALVAGRLIEKGTPGDVVAGSNLFDVQSVREDQLVDGAFTDPGALRGQVATTDIYKGQQLSSDDFADGADPITSRLEGTDRAISVPVDAAHGNIGNIHDGSRVDVLGGLNAEVSSGTARPVLDVLARDVLVLAAPDKPASNTAGSTSATKQQVELRVSDAEASRIALASDQGDVWLTVRPPTLAKNTPNKPVELGSILGLGSTSGG
ncbi:MAG TPA: Flp pilus assembly protein CpaB [Chloroflexota bacterium]|nr:Flp pilus assembly protein CpaB [Chloroflexota bacterium]